MKRWSMGGDILWKLEETGEVDSRINRRYPLLLFGPRHPPLRMQHLVRSSATMGDPQRFRA